MKHCILITSTKLSGILHVYALNGAMHAETSALHTNRTVIANI